MKLPKNQSAFFLGAVDELMGDKVDLHFVRKVCVDNLSGYFSHEPLSLKVAIWGRNWFPVFLHEFFHYKQWKSKTEYWSSAEDTDFLETFAKKDRLKTQLLEQECDIMAYMSIIQSGLENMENYVSESNAYHVSYKNMEDNKCWFKTNNTPSSVQEILDLCPNNRFFTKKELDNPDPKLYSAINEHCF